MSAAARMPPMVCADRSYLPITFDPGDRPAGPPIIDEHDQRPEERAVVVDPGEEVGMAETAVLGTGSRTPASSRVQ